jgi:hypothetical protein
MLVGSSLGDGIGSPYTVHPSLDGTRMLVGSENWDNGAVQDVGAWRVLPTNVRVTGTLSTTNSLVGFAANDRIGYTTANLVNGAWLISSPYADRGALADAGAMTWMPADGITGAISISNSLMGASAYDQAGYSVYATHTGDYFVLSNVANEGASNAGSITWGSGASGITGEVSVRNGSVDQFPLLDRTFAKFGVEVTHEGGWSTARAPKGLKVKEPFTSNILTKVEAAPWPYVPADLLPIFIALGVRAEGSVMFWNKVYEGALGWSSEIGKFGAHSVLCDPHRLITYGGKPLMPATVESPYIIRVAIALFMLAASIEGRSTILNAAPIQRAHPRFVENLNALGADVEWVAGD